MLANVVNWLGVQENIRSHKASEAISRDTLAETQRHNVASEGETQRHNVASEGLTRDTLTETKRHNVQTEGISVYDAQTRRLSAQAAQQQATNSWYSAQAQLQQAAAAEANARTNAAAQRVQASVAETQKKLNKAQTRTQTYEQYNKSQMGDLTAKKKKWYEAETILNAITGISKAVASLAG